MPSSQPAHRRFAGLNAFAACTRCLFCTIPRMIIPILSLRHMVMSVLNNAHWQLHGLCPYGRGSWILPGEACEPELTPASLPFAPL